MYPLLLVPLSHGTSFWTLRKSNARAFSLLKTRGIHSQPNVMELLPPGGFSTRNDGRSVSTFPQFILFPFANELFDTAFLSSSAIERTLFIMLLPPGGFSTRDDGRSVNTFPEFILFEFANELLDTFFAPVVSTIEGINCIVGSVCAWHVFSYFNSQGPAWKAYLPSCS